MAKGRSLWEFLSSGKNIVVCCDGTGNKFGDANSNVIRLYTCLNVDKDQIAYYHPGVGTMGAPNRTSKLGRAWSQVMGLGFGSGFTGNVAGAYKFLMDHHADGDRIFLFGFSRGAYTVRALAGALSLYGLLCPGNEGHLPYLLEMYSAASRDAYKKQRNHLQNDDTATAFKESFSRKCPVHIHFIGIWDTVSTIGWVYDPVKLLFDGQNPIVRRGRHAMAVDERRCYYQKTPWGPGMSPDSTPVLTSIGERQDIVQAWFAGAHSDVGGSYPQSESAPALDAFRWILDEATGDGLHIKPSKRDAILGLHSPSYPLISKFSLTPPSMECLHNSLTRWWWLPELLPHKYFDDDGVKRWQLSPLARRRDIPHNSLLHPSLVHRLKSDPAYQPRNLDRNKIGFYTQSPVPFPSPQTMGKLQRENFGVYLSGPAPLQKGHGFLKAATATAASLTLAAGLLLHYSGRHFPSQHHPAPNTQASSK